MLVDGNVPRAAGMSSSSAFVCAAGLSTAVVSNANLDRVCCCTFLVESFNINIVFKQGTDFSVIYDK